MLSKKNMEIWDAYDRNLNKIDNMHLVRGETIPDGILHLVCDIIVRHSDGTYLLMKRDERKHYGGMWEATAGGAALQGEDPITCAKRELKEETGIVSDNLIELGCIVHYRHHAYYVNYLCNTSVDKDSIKLQEGETVDYKWVTRNELFEMSRDELVTHRIQNFIEELE